MSQMKMYAVAKMASAITYYPQLNSLTGAVTSTILMAQLEYWFGKTRGKPFYKFLEPCPNNPLYKGGDSWTEELKFSSSEFRTAAKRICKIYKSKKEFISSEDKFEGKYYLAYTDKIKGLTYYFRNHKLLDSTLLIWSKQSGDVESPSYVNEETQFTEMKNVDLRNSTNSIYGDEDCEVTEIQNLIYGSEENEVTEIKNLNSDIQEITTGDYLQETTAGDYIQENTHRNMPARNQTKVPYQEVIDAFNSICVSFPRVQQLTDARKTAIKKMWKFAERNMQVLQTLFQKTESSDFLAGRVKEWQANFDWIMRDKKAVAILEGQYDNRQASSSNKGNSFTRMETHDWDLDELERRASDYMEQTLYEPKEEKRYE